MKTQEEKDGVNLLLVRIFKSYEIKNNRFCIIRGAEFPIFQVQKFVELMNKNARKGADLEALMKDVKRDLERV